MPLAVGTRLGSYEILAFVGVGGMGEVYKGRDARLGRFVAIKVLSDRIAVDADRRQRFEREARAISNLNHPHICTLHDVGRDGGVDFLVMEFIEGETLAQRLARGPLSLPLVLRTSAEIAEALDAAHRHGVTHRDLKPGNVMLTKSGAKLLDFGLAKLTEDEGARALLGEATVMARQPPKPLTESGVWLGTMQYMSPEQLEGAAVDQRADVFAFGAVVYEMATGEKAFDGESQASVIGAILKDDPKPISAKQPLSPRSLDALVSTCLAKDPDERWQSMADVARQLRLLQDSLSQSGTAIAEAPARASHRRSIGVGVVLAAVVVGAIGALGVARYLGGAEAVREAPEAVRVRFIISTPGMTDPLSYAVSPDGRYVAFAAIGRTGTQSLFVRAIDDLAPRLLEDTEGAQRPFWSPDSQDIGFATEANGMTLKRVSRTGGPSRVLAHIGGRAFLGGTWNADGVILFGTGPGFPLRHISATTSSEPVDVTHMGSKDALHAVPQFLPDGKHFLFTKVSADSAGLYVASIDARAAEPTRLITDRTAVGRYGNGYLVFARADGTLNAQRFDPKRLTLAGDPAFVAGPIDTSWFGFPSFSLSRTGVLAYKGTERTVLAKSQLVWRDRAGTVIGPLGEPNVYRGVALSPDDRSIAVHIHEENGGAIWIRDLTKNTFTQATFEKGDNIRPVWSPDGRYIAFSSGAPSRLYRKLADGSGVTELLFQSAFLDWIDSWGGGGKMLLFTQWGGANTPGGSNIWALPVDGGEPRPLLATEANEDSAALSPDGRWIAYTSDESGHREVYVRSYPDLAGKRSISKGGGEYARWAHNGKELFYLAGGRTLTSVPIDVEGDALTPGAPHPLFSADVMLWDHESNAADMPFDVTSDGQRFLVNERVTPPDSGTETAQEPSALTVVLNFDKPTAP